ncbi:MAG: DUF433 domain-containing protein [Bryobacteraceae bacterium]
MQFWFLGNRHLFEPSSRIDQTALLSFSDLAEAYIVQTLRRVYHFPIPLLRQSLLRLKQATGSDHPLLGHDIRIIGKRLILASGQGPKRRMLDLTHGLGTQSAIPAVVDAVGRRITFDKARMPRQLFPWRHLGDDQESRPVSVDPEVMSGRLVVSGTRIPVFFLAGMRREGRSIQFIADDYGLPLQTVRQALEHLDTKAA